MDSRSFYPLPDRLPVLAMHGIAIFPLLSVTISARNPRDIKLLEECHSQGALLAVANFTRSGNLALSYENIFPTGTACRISRLHSLGQNRMEAVLEGVCRISFIRLFENSQPAQALIAGFPENRESGDSLTQMLMESCNSLLKTCCNTGLALPESALNLIDRINQPGYLADLVIIYLQPDFATQQKALGLADPRERLKLAHQLLYEKQKELTRGPDDSRDASSRPPLPGFRHDGENDELKQLEEKIKALNLQAEVRKIVLREFRSLQRMNPSSPDYHNILSYIELISELPWDAVADPPLELSKAAGILDDDHYGLEKVKERILEFLAVRSLNPKLKGPILCLVGPPGVGKTSLGQSIARAMQRKFIRLSLGGVHDEAEIRGHRRTYLGALPGKIIQEIRRAESRAPVFMLDEIDKLGRDHRGDPASALLEVMDPEQNHSFVDHYLNLPFDLSQVLFIATANQQDPIPAALKDRMEIITLAGYSEEEKKKIAQRYLVDRQRQNHGLEAEKIMLSDETLDDIIDHYTREAGVRNLEKMIGRIMRKCARAKVEGSPLPKAITQRSLAGYLGPSRYRREAAEIFTRAGIVTGLAWTPTGGEILFIEAAFMPGRQGETPILTGSLGEVMKESAQTALSLLRSSAESFGLDRDFFADRQLHIHIPSGAIPKDGPSAGLAIFLTLLSLAGKWRAEHRIAVTGEISLTGRVLAVGGIKEKVLAARRAGINAVVLPQENLKDSYELPADIRQEMIFYGVEYIDQAIPLVLPGGRTVSGSGQKRENRPVLNPAL